MRDKTSLLALSSSPPPVPRSPSILRALASVLTQVVPHLFEGVLRLFPAWPKDRDARFGNLRTHGAFLVSGELKDGKVQYVSITNERGRDCVVQNPWPGKDVADSLGEKGDGHGRWRAFHVEHETRRIEGVRHLPSRCCPPITLGKDPDMSDINRRSFLKRTAGTLAAATWMSSGVSDAASTLPKATDVRALGNTGLECSYLGIGTGISGRAKGITDLTMKLTGEQFIGLLEYAYAQGITYFDTADQYGSHIYMREAMKKSIPRDKIMLLSKIWSREPKQVQRDIERIRTELETDCIDVLLMHCVRKGEENWPETLEPTMDVLSEAKAKGWIRAHGISSHNIEALECVAESDWADVVLARINAAGIRMDAPIERVVPALERIHKAGKGVLGMKILGQGDPKIIGKMDEALKFVGELGSLDAMTIGFMSEAELDDVVGRINGLA